MVLSLDPCSIKAGDEGAIVREDTLTGLGGKHIWRAV